MKKRTSPPRPRGAKKATTISVQSEKQISGIAMRFHLKGAILTYRSLSAKINEKFGLCLSVGMVWRIAHGYEPKDCTIRHRLGLPVLQPAPVCVKCGEVHTTKRCTKKAKRSPEELIELRRQREYNQIRRYVLAYNG